jgi:Ca2+:H+ antiporter
VLSVFQSGVFGVLILLLYGVFLSVQTVRHPYYFKQPVVKRARKTRDAVEAPPVEHIVLFHASILVLTLLPVVYLTEALAELTGIGLGAIGAPAALAGVIIAVLVLSPEGMGALHASSRNELQRSINITLGSALATVGLTIPAILAISVWRGAGITLGLANEETLLLLLTFLVTAFTFGGAHTNVLMGAVHLVLFLAFLALIFDP